MFKARQWINALRFPFFRPDRFVALKNIAFYGFIFLTPIMIPFLTVLIASGDHQYSYNLKTHWVNDVTQLNPTKVNAVVQPKNNQQISNLLRQSHGPVSIGGGRFSQGGQISYPNSLHFDMRQFNKILGYKPKEKTITVQTGITWRDIQEYIDSDNLSIAIMQSYANFTVGGSLSVNVHGRYMSKGPIVSSVAWIKLALANGDIIIASPTQNPELFYASIGGYGGVGIILEAQLYLESNFKIQRQNQVMPVNDYKNYFDHSIRSNQKIVFHNANIYPPNYTRIRSINWQQSNKPLTETSRLMPKQVEPISHLQHWLAISGLGLWFRQYIVDPIQYKKSPVVWKNWEASYNLYHLEPPSRKSYTYGLREYFVPVAHFDSFLENMKLTFKKHKANILNVSIRHANADQRTFLSWAKGEVFAFVVYYVQGTDKSAQDNVKRWSLEMIDVVNQLNGSYYLPYQIHATPKQFKKAYPRHEKFFQVKNQYDPDNRFTNALWDKYYPKNKTSIAKKKQTLDHYTRPENQTLLTIPEWYIVFNQKEYANFIQKNSPSEFPFLKSINEYWKLYDKTNALVLPAYPRNQDYETMLKIIGLSLTMEYFLKGLYENTIGRLTWAWAGSKPTQMDEFAHTMNHSYSNFIYHTPWYRFPFGQWLIKLWTQNSIFGKHWLRNLERSLFYTVEYSVKGIYGSILSMFAGETTPYTYALLEYNSADTVVLSKNIRILAQSNMQTLLQIPRYVPFTDFAKQLTYDVQLIDVAGNTKLALTALCPKTLKTDLAGYLYDSQVLTSNTLKRVALFVDTQKIQDTLENLNLNQCTLEHVYDY